MFRPACKVFALPPDSTQKVAFRLWGLLTLWFAAFAMLLVFLLSRALLEELP